jgi:hypothetical protein
MGDCLKSDRKTSSLQPRCARECFAQEYGFMPRYFFHVRDGSVLIDDPDGEDMATFEAVQEEAMEGARDILREAVHAGMAASLNKQIEVVDESGATVLVVPVGHVTGTPTQT